MKIFSVFINIYLSILWDISRVNIGEPIIRQVKAMA